MCVFFLSACQSFKAASLVENSAGTQPSSQTLLAALSLHLIHFTLIQWAPEKTFVCTAKALVRKLKTSPTPPSLNSHPYDFPASSSSDFSFVQLALLLPSTAPCAPPPLCLSSFLFLTQSSVSSASLPPPSCWVTAAHCPSALRQLCKNSLNSPLELF